jgi:hypothetical protein
MRCKGIAKTIRGDRFSINGANDNKFKKTKIFPGKTFMQIGFPFTSYAGKHLR